MKLCRPLLLAAALLAPLAVRAAEAPDAEFTRIAALMQAAKTYEAVREIDALIRRYPDDARLPKIRTQLGSAASAATAPAAPAMPAEDRFEINTVRKLIEKAQAATEADARRLLLEQVLERTDRIVRKYPKEVPIWSLRAMAAVVLDRPNEGRLAGRTLKSLGALESDDTALGDLMTELNIKGWLKDAAQLQDDSSARIKRWTGTWVRPATKFGSTRTAQYLLRVDASLAENVSVWFEVILPFEHAERNSYSYGSENKVPGAYISREVDDDGVVFSAAKLTNRISSVRFMVAETILIISYHYEGTVQHHSKVEQRSGDTTICFFHDPNVSNAVLLVSDDEVQLAPNELRQKIAAKLGDYNSTILLRK